VCGAPSFVEAARWHFSRLEIVAGLALVAFVPVLEWLVDLRVHGRRRRRRRGKR